MFEGGLVCDKILDITKNKNLSSSQVEKYTFITDNCQVHKNITAKDLFKKIRLNVTKS